MEDVVCERGYVFKGQEPDPLVAEKKRITKWFVRQAEGIRLIFSHEFFHGREPACLYVEALIEPER